MNLSDIIECDLRIERMHNCLFRQYDRDWSYDHNGNVRGHSAIYYVKSGVLEVSLEDNVFRAGADSILLLDCGVHSTMNCRDTGESGTLDTYQLCFTADRKFEKLGLPVCLESQSRYLRTFEQIYSVWNLNSIAYQLKTRSMIENLLYNLVYDSAMGRTLPQISIRLMDLLDYIHSNYMNRLTSNDLSRVINYSPSHIRRLFMNEFKMTPVKYINKLHIFQGYSERKRVCLRWNTVHRFPELHSNIIHHHTVCSKK